MSECLSCLLLHDERLTLTRGREAVGWCQKDIESCYNVDVLGLEARESRRHGVRTRTHRSSGGRAGARVSGQRRAGWCLGAACAGSTVFS